MFLLYLLLIFLNFLLYIFLDKEIAKQMIGNKQLFKVGPTGMEQN